MNVVSKIQILILIVFLIFSMSMITASEDLECSLIPHYMQQGSEITVYSNDTIFDGLYFSVICSNNLPDEKILSLSVVNASPIELYNALPNKIIDYIAIKNKLLYTSNVISVKNLNETFVNFSVSIMGLSEKSFTVEKAEATKDIFIKNKENSQIMGLGSTIFPSHPTLGLVIFLVLGGLSIFLIWDYGIGKKINLWKRKRLIRKLEKRKQEERYRQMR